MKKFIAVSLSVTMLALTLAGCSGGGSTAATTAAPAETQAASGGSGSEAPTGGITSAKDSMVVVVKDDIGTFDPHDNNNFAPSQIRRQIWETLFVRDEAGELQPWLCESYEYEDDETIIMHIRKGVKFHNGDELKASDVLFSFKRAQDDNTTGALQVNRMVFDKCEVIDDYTLKIVTDGPYAMQLPMLENPLIVIISERAYNESGGDFSKAPIGTGPYKFVSYAAGDNIVLEANPDYWIPGQPYVKNLTFRVITDASSRAIEAESGGADIVYDISANDVERVKSNPNVNLLAAAGYNTSYMLMNQNHAPLDDIRVRQAICLGMNVPQAIDIAYGSFGQVASGIVSPGVEGRKDDLVMPTQDIEKAKQLLAEAGYADGLTLEIICENSNQQRMDFCEAAQAQLKEIGIELVPKFLDSNDWVQTTVNGGTDISVYGTTASTGEAGRILMRFADGTSEFGAINWKGPEADAYRELINKALATIDSTERNKMYDECQQMIMDNFVALPIWHKEINAALQKDVKGFYLMPTYECHYLQYVYF